jgi:uncharacterized tellurite resistance protein B-like protein
MELTDLTHDEQLALVAVIELVVAADRTVSDDEQAAMARVAAVIGDENYRALAATSDERFADDASLRAFLTGLQRQEARELIYGTVLEVALPDTVDTQESSFLEWLAKAWSITVRIVEE